MLRALPFSQLGHFRDRAAASCELETGVAKYGIKHGYIVATAESNEKFEVPSWNAGTCCGEAMTSNSDDVGYFRKMIDILIEKYRVDESRIFATGWSNGGYMTYRLACELSDKIAGGAPFVGILGWKKAEKE